MKNQDVSIEVVANEYSLLVYFVENIEFFMWTLGIVAIGLTTLRYFTFKNTASISNKDDYIELKMNVGSFRECDKTFCSKCDDFFIHIEENKSIVGSLDTFSFFWLLLPWKWALVAAVFFDNTKTDAFCANCHPTLWENWCMYTNDQKTRWELKNRRNWVFLMCVFFGIMLLANSEDSVVLAIFFK